jgi:hypothetical protein
VAELTAGKTSVRKLGAWLDAPAPCWELSLLRLERSLLQLIALEPADYLSRGRSSFEGNFVRRVFFIILLLGLLFYVVWPGYSGYQIFDALRRQDAALLERKVDLPAVRVSMRHAVETAVEDQIDQQLKIAGDSGAVIAAQLKKEVMPSLVELALNKLVTPANIIRVYTERGDVGQSIERIIGEQIDKTGLPGLGGAGGLSADDSVVGRLGRLTRGVEKFGVDADKVVGANKKAEDFVARSMKPSDGAPMAVGLSNIKDLTILGPLAFEVGLAKDPAALKPDVTAGMAFTGFDWKLTRLVPHI